MLYKIFLAAITLGHLKFLNAYCINTAGNASGTFAHLYGYTPTTSIATQPFGTPSVAASTDSASASASLPSSAVLTTEEKNARFEAFTASMDKYRKQWNIPGIAVSVITTDPVTQKRSVLFKGLGQTDSTKPDSIIDENTVWQLASMSKLFTGYLVASVVEEGILSWDKALSQYTDVSFADATINQTANLLDVLSHATGLSRTDYRYTG
jgi:CubicO group peptidase (beta-lactamase class C family)